MNDYGIKTYFSGPVKTFEKRESNLLPPPRDTPTPKKPVMDRVNTMRFLNTLDPEMSISRF